MQSFFTRAVIILSVIFSASVYATDTGEIYLTRHAEKQHDASGDPCLTKMGLRRAENIAKFLQSKNISAIYSTNYKRTMETALATAKLLDIEIKHYDPNKLKELSERLKKLSANILVVGHSNTTPAMVELLGGDAHGGIKENEYGRLYHLKHIQGKLVTNLIKLADPK